MELEKTTYRDDAAFGSVRTRVIVRFPMDTAGPGQRVATSMTFGGNPEPLTVAQAFRDLGADIQKQVFAPHLSDKDGVQRNIAQFKQEWQVLRPAMRKHWRRFKRRWWDTHSATNLAVESMRVGCEYLVGHVVVIAFACLALFNLATLALLLWRW